MYHILLTTKRLARTVGYQLDMLWRGLHVAPNEVYRQLK